MMIKNLSQLKKTLKPGKDFEILAHCRPECVGEHRRVNIANTQGFYSIIPDDPTSRVKGARAVWGGIRLHPHYEAKTMQWFLQSGLHHSETLFWIVGAEPSNKP